MTETRKARVYGKKPGAACRAARDMPGRSHVAPGAVVQGHGYPGKGGTGHGRVPGAPTMGTARVLTALLRLLWLYYGSITAITAIMALLRPYGL